MRCRSQGYIYDCRYYLSILVWLKPTGSPQASFLPELSTCKAARVSALKRWANSKFKGFQFRDQVSNRPGRIIRPHRGHRMDAFMAKAGSFWFSRRANKEISSFGDDINSFSDSVEGGTKWLINKLKGTMQKPLPDLLQEYHLPKGLFPKNATNYEFDEETGKLTVFIPSICEVGFKDSSVLRYATTVIGYLEKGKLTDIEGMKTKVLIWAKVTSVSVDGPQSSKVYFTAGMKKSRSRDAYEVRRDGISVETY